MSEALRSLLASFTVEVDKAGELAKGNAEVASLAARLGDLQQAFARVRAPAAAAGKAIADSFAGAFGSPQLAAAMQLASQNAAANLFGNFGAAQGLDLAQEHVGAVNGPDRVFGPTRETLAAHVTATRTAAQSLRGQLASAWGSVSKSASAAGSRIAGVFRSVEVATRPGGGSVFDSLLTLKNGFAALAGGAAVRGLLGVVDHIGGIGEAAAKLGVTTDEFQRLDVLAKQNATSVEGLGTAFRQLSRVAVTPTKESAAAFKELGISVKDGKDFKSRNALFFETAGALADVSDETKRAALAQRVFGEGGTQLLPLLSQGRAGLDAQRAALEKMNVITPDAIDQADKFSDRLVLLKANALGKLTPALLRLLPTLEKLANLFVKGADVFARFASRLNLGSLAVVGLAAKLSGLGSSALKAGAQMARMLLPLLLLEDIFTFFDGGDSLTGRLMTFLFGEDGGAQIQQAAVDIKNALGEIFTGDFVGPAFSQIKKDLQEFFEFLDKSNFVAHGLLETMRGLKTVFVDAPVALGNAAANATGLGTTDNRTQHIEVHVGTAAEVGPAVAGATQALGRDAAADNAAVGGNP